MSDEIKQAILEVLEKNSGKGKKKTYPKDIAKALSDRFERRDVKKIIPEMIESGEVSYWSAGSTTYIMLKADFEQLKATEEEG